MIQTKFTSQMGIPDFKLFSRPAAKDAYFIFSKAISADLETPVSAYLKLSRGSQSAFLFESVERGEKQGRYSLLAANPRQVIEYNGERTYVQGREMNRRSSVFVGDPLRFMELSMSQIRIANPFSAFGFQGGYVGFMSYESVVDFEAIRLRKKASGILPRSIFFLVEDYLVFDHLKHTLEIVVLIKRSGNLKSAHHRGLEKIRQLESLLRIPVPSRKAVRPKKQGRIRSNMRPAHFKKCVKKIKQYINAGDCIQVVFSQKFALGRVTDSFQVYRELRSLNPSPYMFYFKHNDIQLVGSSPEMLVKKCGNVVELRPIAGTRPRGTNEQADRAFERELKSSAKEHAEHLMLVDLGRNDIGRVSRFKTVHVNEYARIERYSHVMHLVSDVVGLLEKDKNMFDVLRAAFPAGTVTGAPKVRAMQIIDELEKTERGPYAGSVGYLSFSGDMDMCITIRTILIKNGNATVQAGAGIVYDSNPEAEYHETMNKAKALFRAVEKVNRK
ncbi:MAG: anthranilate synthase component I [Candidatus Omnitrophica bacterium]|nr:anthranilate synthase component I [Candidatus Omnitrophota bacterium]